MSSFTLPSQSFQPARPLSFGEAARALTTAIAAFAAPLRAAVGATRRGLKTLILAAAASELRERAQAHLAANPSYAADLAAAADQLQAVERA